MSMLWQVLTSIGRIKGLTCGSINSSQIHKRGYEKGCILISFKKSLWGYIEGCAIGKVQCQNLCKIYLVKSNINTLESVCNLVLRN